ncbi:MAG TPA: 23S rRNA (guanosine(2251)-2'-O)-methyltransferase RlmB [Clostridiaceae bacterium]|nr:23S rRNA (guanosine(2251)-2'-O)-methyltransferase RlmB [Clostridiaceae bacterium]
MNYISSSKNPLIKEVKSLKKRKCREDKNLFFVEGIKITEEALKENAEIVRVLVSEEFVSKENSAPLMRAIESRGYKCFILPEKLFKEISDTETPQGIMAVVRAKHSGINEIIHENSSLIILDAIQDPGNMGTIIRTADAAGFDGIIISRGCVDIYNPKVIRATMGSVFRVPFHFSENLADTIRTLKSRDIRVVAAHLKGDKNYFELDMKGKIALVIGNEASGISDEVTVLADDLVLIPMAGRTESLNASVAAGLLMYEVLRQRWNKKF